MMGKMKRSLFEELVEGIKEMEWQRHNDGSNFVYYNEDGDIVTILNGVLLKKQNIQGKDLQLLCKSHALLKKIKELMDSLSPVEHKEQLRRLWKLGDDCEALQQLLWGFDVDPSYRMFWKYSGCSCPKLDNQDRWGTGYYIVTKDCVLHGDECELI